MRNKMRKCGEKDIYGIPMPHKWKFFYRTYPRDSMAVFRCSRCSETCTKKIKDRSPDKINIRRSQR